MSRGFSCASPIALSLVAAGLLGAAAAQAKPGDAYCSVPGELVAEDATGDATFIVAPEVIPGHDVHEVRIAELPGGDGIDRIHFTLTIDALAPAFTPLSSYEVEFMLGDGVERFVRFTPYPVPPEAAVFEGQDLMFSYGHRGVDPTTGNGVFSIDGPADPASSASPDGTITIVLPVDVLPLETPNDFLINVAGIAQHNYMGGATLDVDQSDAPGVYQLHGSASCSSGKDSDLLGINVGAASPLLLALFGLAALRRRPRG